MAAYPPPMGIRNVDGASGASSPSTNSITTVIPRYITPPDWAMLNNSSEFLRRDEYLQNNYIDPMARESFVDAYLSHVERQVPPPFTHFKKTPIDTPNLAKHFLEKLKENSFIGLLSDMSVDSHISRYIIGDNDRYYAGYYMGRPSTPTEVNSRTHSGMGVSLSMVIRDQDRVPGIRPGTDIMVVPKDLITEATSLIKTINEKDSVEPYLAVIKGISNRLSTMQSNISDVLAAGLDEESSLNVEDVVTQCNLEIQEMIDGLEKV